MNPDDLFILIVGIVVLNYLFTRLMEYLNSRRYGDPVPEGLEDVYDEDEYRKSMEYKKVNYRFSILTGTFGTALILAMFFLNGFAFLDDLVRRIAENPILLALLFFAKLNFNVKLSLGLFNFLRLLYSHLILTETLDFQKMLTLKKCVS